MEITAEQQRVNPRDAGGRSLMTLRIASEPEKVTAELRKLVASGFTAGEIADRYGVSHQTVLRWRWRLEAALGETKWERLGFAFRLGRRPLTKPAPKRASGKKRGRPKKGVDN